MKRYRAYAWFDIQVKEFYEVESETDEDALEQIEELISEDGGDSTTASIDMDEGEEITAADKIIAAEAGTSKTVLPGEIFEGSAA